jgi:hypothetical protein
MQLALMHMVVGRQKTGQLVLDAPLQTGVSSGNPHAAITQNFRTQSGQTSTLDHFIVHRISIVHRIC